MTATISKKGVPKNFAKFTVKHHKGPQACNFIKKGIWHRCFPENFVTFLRTLFLIEYLRWLLLNKESSPMCVTTLIMEL